jgi:dTDP-4-amino-4,6-dideoxygalactose transaminase
MRYYIDVTEELSSTMRQSILPYCAPSIGQEEIDEVVDTLRRGFLSSGPKVTLFEKSFAEYIGVEHAIAASSCTAALTVALAAVGIRPGDEVILPTLTFCATANVVEHFGAKPILVDVTDELQIDPDAAKRAISSRTRAIMPVHYGGQACRLTELLSLAHSYDLAVIQDAAHAVGTEYQGRKIGSFDHVTAFSFYPSKNMTTGEGGMLTTSDGALARRLREFAVHGIHRNLSSSSNHHRSWNYQVCQPGYKANMFDVQAAIGIQQLKKLDAFIAKRRYIAQQYSDAFSDLDELILPIDLHDRPQTYHLYPMRIAAARLNCDREALIELLLRSNIEPSVHYIPLHQHTFYREKYGYATGAFPMADACCRSLLSLPLYPAMSEDDVTDVIEAVRSAVKQLGVDASADKRCRNQEVGITGNATEDAAQRNHCGVQGGLQLHL